MVLLGHLPIWTPSAYSETVTPAGSMTWRTGHADGTLTITVGERIAIDPDADFAQWAAYHLVSVAVEVTVH